jgi:hypothetical protein
VDEGFGEDIVGTAVTGKLYKRYPASFARFAYFMEGPVGETGAGGFLDKDGCIPPGMLPPEVFLHVAGGPPGNPEEGGLNVIFGIDASMLRNPDGTHYDITSRDSYTTLGFYSTNPEQIPHGAWTTERGWSVPPPRIDAVSDVLTPLTNVAASLGNLLGRPDMGYLVDNPSTPGIDEGTYPVVQGDGCYFPDRLGNPIVQSCVTNETLYIGTATAPPNATACTRDEDCRGRPEIC